MISTRGAEKQNKLFILNNTLTMLIQNNDHKLIFPSWARAVKYCINFSISADVRTFLPFAWAVADYGAAM